MLLISVGGIESADDVWERVLAGATLVQAYTGFIYGGPALAARGQLRSCAPSLAVGQASIEELVGSAAAPAGDQ